MYNCGLVLEGGGTRAMYTSGVLDAFMEKNIEFPYIIGVSAGSCNGASFIAKCYKRQHDINIKYCNDKRYMSINSLIKNGEYLNGDWIFGELCYELSPLDMETYDKANTVLCAVVTNAATGKPEYMYPKNLHKRGCPILRASCSLPGATKGVVLGKDVYFDGGITDSIPLKRAYQDGCKKAVVILTQDEHYMKQPLSHPRLIKKALKQYPMLANDVLNRHNMYNAQIKYAWNAHNSGDAYVIAPKTPLKCKTLERNTDKLEQVYQQGYMDGLQNADAVIRYINS